MFVRLALADEAELLVEMARDAVTQTKPEHEFDAERVRTVFTSYLQHAHPTFFFVEQNRKVIGFLQAEMGLYDFTSGMFTVQKTVYVQRDKRGTRAATLLMQHFIDWSRVHIGAKEAFGGVDNDFHAERTAGFLERFGFKRVGYAMTLDLRNG